MKKTAITLTLTFIYVLATVISSQLAAAHAQTQNQTTKAVFTESFTFPNECTGELMDVSDTTTVVCHQQQRADGLYDEKCQIVQKVTAVGQTTGLTFRGTGTFKDELTATDACNFSFSNRGAVRLISPGSDVNLILNFDELTRMENCVLTADSHFQSADCRGRQP
ncbi:MAG: hypothetical protein ACJ74W_16300 [Pyrinomonadaceae bacterium]